MPLAPESSPPPTPLTDWLSNSAPLQRSEFLPSASWSLRLGGLGLMGVVVSLLGLATTIPYSNAVLATATVRPRGGVQQIQAATTGVVTALEVQENQQVTAGQVLVQIDTLELERDRQSLQLKIQSTEQQLQDLSKEALDLEKQFAAQQNFQTQRESLGRTQLAQAQGQQQAQHQIAQSELAEAMALLDLAQEEQQRYEELTQAGAISQLQFQEKRQAFKVAQARVAKARAIAQPPIHALATIQAEINQAQAEGTVQLDSLRQAQQALRRETHQLQTQLQEHRQSLQHLESQRRSHQIKAPSGGTLLQFTLRNRGQVVHRGDTIGQIVPATDWVIQARVSPEAIAQIKRCDAPKATRHRCTEGQAQVRIDAYPYPEYGTMAGWVTEIASDTQQSPAGKAYYTLTIELAEPAFHRHGKRYPLQAGMTGTAELLGPPETLLRFWLRKVRLWV